MDFELPDIDINDFLREFSNVDEWVEAIINKHENVFPRFSFPAGGYFDEFINNIESYSVEQVKSLLKELLIPHTTIIAPKRLTEYVNLALNDESNEFIKNILVLHRKI